MINLKVAVIVDHSYHQKTRSSEFFHAFLKECFDQVVAYWDDSWKGGEPVSCEEINATCPDSVFFFQVLYKPEFLAAVACKSIYHVPMYDGVVSWSDAYWLHWRKLKFITFSATLHRKLSALGIQSFHIQYFPPCAGHSRRQDAAGVFWPHRSAEIGGALVGMLFEGSGESRLVLHETTDPGLAPERCGELEKMGWIVETTEWYSTKNAYLDSVSRCKYFMAPRVYEGIGFAFLEAMSMGLCVVAPDNPTMNEYIQNMKSGVLFNIKSPKAPRWGQVDAESVGQEAKRVIRDGRKAYEARLKELKGRLSVPDEGWTYANPTFWGVIQNINFHILRMAKRMKHLIFCRA